MILWEFNSLVRLISNFNGRNTVLTVKKTSVGLYLLLFVERTWLNEKECIIIHSKLLLKSIFLCVAEIYDALSNL